ncbi:uncharacterized protein LOC130725664 [Lotus japonicus]|uniref:uncharacterized protein LOC130725664 n=1 Tax=Lotus japonicus TaxID=34305 RepID=UPI0025852F8F|nr:uncharacterized protein LOC130725664 [Lotus japonicus]
MDDKGCKIHATVRKTLIYRFQSSLTEGKVYQISYFGVGESGRDFRPIEHPFKINFDIQTSVRLLPNKAINITPCNWNSNGRKWRTGVRKGCVRVECAFFGKYVSEVIGYLSSVDATNAVVVVQCCKIKSFKGKTNIQNVYGATKVLFNPQIQEAAPLRARIIDKTPSVFSSIAVPPLSVENYNYSTPFNSKEFADWLLQVGDGTVTTIGEAEPLIEISPDLLIEPCKDPLLEIVNFSYPKLLMNLEKNSFFQGRAILAPTLESVEEINNFMLAMIPGDETEYLSYDTPCKSDEDSGVNAEWFTYEFLNDYKCSGIPNHQIKLKVGVPIMLIRNIDQAAGINKSQAAYWSSNLKDNSFAIRLCCSNIELVAKFNFKFEVIITEHGQQVLLSDHAVDIFVIF